MALKLFAPADTVLIQNSTAEGLIFVENTRLFRTGATAQLTADAQPTIFVYIIDIQDINTMLVQIPTTTPGTSYVGSDVSAYTTAGNAHIYMAEQVGEDSGQIEWSRQVNVLKADATSLFPVASKYLPVRLTDGSAFYNAAGGGSGGSVQNQVRNATNTDWVNVGVGTESISILHIPIRFQGTGANVVEPLNVAPVGSEWAIPVRNINNGTQVVAIADLPLPDGAATESTLSNLPDLTGVWGYKAGTSGVVDVDAGRVLMIKATCGMIAGVISINGGDPIPIPPGGSVSICPKAQLVAPTIIFTTTNSYLVEYVI